MNEVKNQGYAMSFQTGERTVMTKEEAQSVLRGTGMVWMCKPEELLENESVRGMVEYFGIDIKTLARIPVDGDGLDGVIYRYSFEDTPVSFERCTCCKHVIPEGEFILNHGMCSKQMHKGLEIANEAQGYNSSDRNEKCTDCNRAVTVYDCINNEGLCDVCLLHSMHHIPTNEI